MAHFGESRLKFPLPQQEIAVSPRDLGGKRVDLFGVQKSVTCSDDLGFRFISGGKIQPNVRRSRIQRQSKKVGVNGARGVGILEVVLPITTQEIPVLRFSRLQMHGALISFRRLQTSVMGRECISNAEVREDQGDSKTSTNKYRALRVARETQNHSSVLCLDRFGVARQKSIVACDNRAFWRNFPAERR